MLEQIYDIDDLLTEDDYYDALIFIIGDVYPHHSEEELEKKIEGMLDGMPEDYSESILNTIANVGKNIASGSLDIVAQNPALLQGAGTAAGSLIGGPVGAKVGSELGKFGAKELQKNVLPATIKTLSVMQNPQAQTAIARAALGVGNGVAPLTQNGNVSLIPVATYLRALISSAQKALIELDSKAIIPPASFSESMPYSEDIDMQAEWLSEQLCN